MMRSPFALPAHFSVSEQAQLREHLAHAFSSSKPYAGNWHAPFLLSPIHGLEWKLRTSESRLVDGEWTRVKTVRWDIVLPNDTRLSDPENESLRVFAQKTCFLVRALPGSGYESVNSYLVFIKIFLLLLRWCVSKGKQLNVVNEHFTHVDTAVLDTFLRSYSKEGALGLMQYHAQFLRIAYRNALARAPTSKEMGALYAVGAHERKKIVAWLKSEGFFNVCAGSGRSTFAFVDRTKLACLLGTEPHYLQGDKFTAFMRQFEPTIASKYPALCVPANVTGNEYPSHRTPILSEVIKDRMSASRMTNVVGILKSVFSLRRHLSDSLPTSDALKFERLHHYISKGTPSGHTPRIPLEIALEFTRESLRWVSVYGTHVVDFYLKAINTFDRNGWLEAECQMDYRRNALRRDKWIRQHMPPALEALNITRWASKGERSQRFEQLRSAPTMIDAVQILIGACATTITAMKPMREDEFLSLKRTCLVFHRGDGFWITHRRGKAVVEDVHMRTKSPVPTVVARAVQLLGQLGEGIGALCSDDDAEDKRHLLYLPDFSTVGATAMASRMGMKYLHTAIDLFCDFIALPTDELGRRWYCRTHEHRKTFVITFVLCFKHAAIDAARQLLGHTDQSHINAYLQENFPGVDLSELEAEAVSAMLWDFFASNRRDKGAANIEALYASVCKHFSVREISEISEDDLEDWLRVCFKAGDYDLVPYDIGTNRYGKARCAIKIVIKRKHKKTHEDSK